MIDRDTQFLDLYNKYRYDEQKGFYAKREEEFERAQSEFTLISAILMGLAALMSVLSSVDLFGFKLWFAVLAVIFPTLSAALSTYDTLYAFDRQAKIYRDAFHRLNTTKSPQPVQTPSSESEYREAIIRYVNEVETTSLEERGQWGLLADISTVEAPFPQS